MEVHHHSNHSHSSGKKWNHYFWEFFMLFLAVTLGFFVENQREHFVEHRREKDYIRSYIKDLNEDVYQLDSLVRYGDLKNTMMDSMTQPYTPEQWALLNHQADVIYDDFRGLCDEVYVNSVSFSVENHPEVHPTFVWVIDTRLTR